MSAMVTALRVLSFYLRATTVDRGRWRLIPWTLAKVRVHGAEMGTAVVSTRHGFRMKLQLNDWVDQHIYVTGTTRA